MENGKRDGIVSTTLHRLRTRYIALGALGAAIIMVLWGFLLFYTPYRPGYDDIEPMRFQVMQLNGNWSVRIEGLYQWISSDHPPRIPSIALSEATITVRNANGTVRQPMDHVTLSNLTAGNWEIYKAYYQRNADESNIAIGAHIILDLGAYLVGSNFVIQAYPRVGYLEIIGGCYLE